MRTDDGSVKNGPGDPRRLLTLLAAGFLLVVFPALLWAGEPDPEQVIEESPFLLDTEPGTSGENEQAATATPRFQGPHATTAQSQPPAEAGASESAAVARTVASLLEEPAPDDEVYALIRVTDRKTGEQRILTRGTATPELALYIRDPASAPPGESYGEGDDFSTDGEVEIARRFVTRHLVPLSDENADPTEEEEEELDLWLRNQGGELSHRIEQGLRQRHASGEIDLDGGVHVPVVVTLKSVPRLRLPRANDVTVGGLLWAGLDIRAAREKAIIERKQQIEAIQRGVIEQLERAGSQAIYASWTSGAVDAHVPAYVIPELAARDDVFSIEYNEPIVTTCTDNANDCFQGDDYHLCTDAEDFDPDHPGSHGVNSKHSYTSRVIIANADKCIDFINLGWRNGNQTQRGWYYDCDPNGPCTQGGVEICPHSHGTHVTGLMVADFMEGQDPLVGAANRRKMTGTCPECRFFFLQDQNLNELSKTMDAACDLGVDIYNASWGTKSIDCDGNGSTDSQVQALVNCDVLFVTSAGNEDSDGGCSTTYPASHPWTFAVGGIDSDACDTAGEYYGSTCDYDPGASRGGGTYDGSGTASIIDMAAPYDYSSLIVPWTFLPTQRTWGRGTSYSSPVVAGLTGRFLDWWKVHVSNSLFYDNRARNFMLLFGDRSRDLSGVFRAENFFSVYWGAGRVGLVPFDDKPISWIHRRAKTLSSNESWTFTDNVSTSATFYKAVVWHTGKDYKNEPKIRLTLNPGGCSTVTKSVDRLDSKAMLVYGGTPLNGCDRVVVTVKNIKVGSSGSRKFHFGAYTDTEDERHY